MRPIDLAAEAVRAARQERGFGALSGGSHHQARPLHRRLRHQRPIDLPRCRRVVARAQDLARSGKDQKLIEVQRLHLVFGQLRDGEPSLGGEPVLDVHGGLVDVAVAIASRLQEIGDLRRFPLDELRDSLACQRELLVEAIFLCRLPRRSRAESPIAPVATSARRPNAIWRRRARVIEAAILNDSRHTSHSKMTREC